ncbi:MAG TPA: DUF4136 domain-containing protein [Chryseolinea sp.]|nr:DUF4136 domain-containing protein [Chryseolinea sp.]
MKRLLILLPAIALLACEPPADTLRLLDQLVVSTNYDTEADFSQYATYSMATDTIGFYSNQSPNDTIIVQTSSDNYARPVLSKVQQNLQARGFQRVDRNADPDLRINVYVVNDFNVYQQINYPGYYYPSYYGYGYGYGGYYGGYPYVSNYVTNTGALVVEILDLRNPTADKKLKSIWNASMGDVYSTIDLVKQSEEALDQAFVQSPYLGR